MSNIDDNWDEYGEYLEKEEYKNAKALKKPFTARGIKNILTFLLYAFLVLLIGTILFRIFTNKPTAKMTEMLRTPDLVTAYADDSGLNIVSQELHHYYTDDGMFTLYDVRYVPKTSELQFTVRYNNSSARSLSEVYPNDNISKTPFVFVLKDNNGNVYTDYYIVEFERTVYQYARLSFKVPDLFNSVSELNDKYYPVPEVENGSYIYKGTYDSSESDKHITTLYFNAYYEKDVNLETNGCATPIVVYSSSYQVENYDYKKQLKGDITPNMEYVSVKTTD